MIKYDRAIFNLRLFVKYFDSSAINEVETLQELVDKQTPMKPKKTNDGYESQEVCPNCETLAITSNGYPIPRCYECGQRIEWDE